MIGFAVGAFFAFVIYKLRKIDSQTDSIYKPKYHWNMGIYIEDIPKNEQNLEYLSSIPLKIYNWGEYPDLLVPRKGEKIYGIYDSGEHRFEISGIIESVLYNTDIDWIVVECKCTDIQKLNF